MCEQQRLKFYLSSDLFKPAFVYSQWKANNATINGLCYCTELSSSGYYTLEATPYLMRLKACLRGIIMHLKEEFLGSDDGAIHRDYNNEKLWKLSFTSLISILLMQLLYFTRYNSFAWSLNCVYMQHDRPVVK